MAEIIGKIGDLTAKGVEVIKLHYQELIKALREGSLEDLYEPPLPERALDLFLGPRLTLKFAPEAIDSLVEHAGNFCRITVKDGAIVNVAPFKNEHEILEEVKSLLLKREGAGLERFLKRVSRCLFHRKVDDFITRVIKSHILRLFCIVARL